MSNLVSVGTVISRLVTVPEDSDRAILRRLKRIKRIIARNRGEL